MLIFSDLIEFENVPPFQREKGRLPIIFEILTQNCLKVNMIYRWSAQREFILLFEHLNNFGKYIKRQYIRVKRVCFYVQKMKMKKGETKNEN